MTAAAAIDPREIPAYTVGEATHYLGIPKSTMRSWFAGQQRFRAVIRPAEPKGLGLSFPISSRRTS